MDEKWIDTFRTEIGAFSGKIQEFQRGEIDRKAYKGYSGGFGSYAQRDAAKNMLRLRMAGGRITKDRLKYIADSVAEYDISLLKLTTCQAVQLHNLTADQVPALMEQAIDCGIYTRGGGGDNPRNVMCSPLSGVQAGEAFDVLPYAEAAAQYLLGIAREIHMPRKLKVAFCNDTADSVHATFRDMGFIANTDGTFTLYIAGGLGGNPMMGVKVIDRLPASDILYCLKAMIDTFCAHGDYNNRARARTRFMQLTLGADGLREAFLKNYQAAREAGGLDVSPAPITVSKTGNGAIEHARVIPQKQDGLYTVSYHPIGGVLPTGKPAELYAVIKDMPEVECRVHPAETLYILNLTAEEAKKVLAVTADGAQTQFEHSVACIGSSICQQGIRDSQSALNAVVEAVRAEHFADGILPVVHFSGCPSSCAAHQIGEIGFQGCVRVVDKQPLPAFRMTVNGTDAMHEERFGEVIGVILERDIPALLIELGRTIAAQNSTWAQWAPQNTETIRSLAQKYL
ncbi:MAG: nitrite/sulfite reductase [Butyricicoccaceae bacterium]